MNSRFCIGTIVSANYLAYAKTLSDSVAKHAPDADFRVLIVDRMTEVVKSAVARSGLKAIFAEQLGLADFEHLAFKYEIVELNTALKPTFLKRLFLEGYGRVAYFDPDIQIFSPLNPVQQALDTADIVLTPHAIAPVIDGFRPSDIDFLRNGSFNLGFIALGGSRESSAMLDWWEARCLAFGHNDLIYGTFVDQKWIDLVPSYFESVKVLRHPGCNVAYWNLHERSLRRDTSGYSVNSEPLCFFHFSGVKAHSPEVLSRHQTRHHITPHSELADLVSNYCSSLISNGHDQYAKIAYTFARFDNGDHISPIARRAATFAVSLVEQPFSANSIFHKQIRSQNLITTENSSVASINTLNFDAESREVRLANRLIRWACKIVGVDRVYKLLKYFTFLNREANFARVLFGEPFDLVHKPKGTRPR